MMDGIDEEITTLMRREAAFRDARSSTAARLLSLVRVGVEFDDSATLASALNLASLAETHSLSPDDVQEVLVRHEPQLGEVQYG